MKSKKFIATDIAEIALFVALMTASAYIQIPFPLVPLTFQTVVAVLCGLFLGAKKGVISMAVYCFAGVLGLPVFAAGGGFAYVLKPSFGYILGFILSAGVAGLTVNKTYSAKRCLIAAVAGMFFDYLIGAPYCIICAHLLGVKDLVNLLLVGNLVYIPKDLILCVLSAMLAKTVAPVVLKRKKTHAQIHIPKDKKI